MIIGRKTFQSGEKKFCNRYCAVIANRAINGIYNYVSRGFAETIRRKGRVECERCGQTNIAALIVHHKNRNRKDSTASNLETLCATCHQIEHWQDSKERAKNLRLAIDVAEYLARSTAHGQFAFSFTESAGRDKATLC